MEFRYDSSSVTDLAFPLSRGFGYDEVAPIDFYREIFPIGEFQQKGKYNDLKYNGIALEIFPNDVNKRYTITDELDTIMELLKSPNFVIVSPISYVGKTRSSKNARCFYALCIEIDDLIVEGEDQVGLKNLMFQIENGVLPRPTFIVCSGFGLHLYYQFEKPLFLFKNVVERLQNYKRWLTRKVWNRDVTGSYKEFEVQYESLFQGFRMVGGVTKRKIERTICFRTGEKVSTKYMNSFLPKEPLSKKEKDVSSWKDLFIPATYKYNSEHSLEDAKKLYPEWYERRVVKKQNKNTWTNKVDLYKWWLREIKAKGMEGHRYYCLMMLVIYALKCGVSEETVRKDCNSLLDDFESLTPPGSNNHFTQSDINDALKCYKNPDLITYPINSIMNRTGIAIEKNRRNGRPQADHVRLMNFVRDELKHYTNWRDGNGRKPKQDIILNWRKEHPEGNKYQCYKDTKMSRTTIDKWWSTQIENSSY